MCPWISGFPTGGLHSIAQIFLQVFSLGKDGPRNARSRWSAASQRRAVQWTAQLDKRQGMDMDGHSLLNLCIPKRNVAHLTCRIGYPERKPVVDASLNSLWAKSDSLVTTSSKRSRTISWLAPMVAGVPPNQKNPMDSQHFPGLVLDFQTKPHPKTTCLILSQDIWYFMIFCSKSV